MEENTILTSAAFGSGQIVATDQSTVPHYYLCDHLGSTRAIVTSAGVTETYDYYPYGLTWQQAERPIGTNTYLFTGKEWQAQDGVDLYDFGARFYQPRFGKWLSIDPLAEEYMGISPYAYCGNDPVNRVDPDGRRIWPVDELYKGQAPRHSNDFGKIRSFSNHPHGGVDINIGNGNFDLGAPVYATHSGVIVRVGVYTDNDAGGNRIKIESTDKSVATFYMHLNSIDPKIYPGATVEEGQIIGTIGGSGRDKSGKGIKDAYSPYLHYEMYKDGAKVNPADKTGTLIDPETLLKPAMEICIPSVIVQGTAPGRPYPKYIDKELEAVDFIDFRY